MHRRRVLGVEVDEDEPLPRLDLDRGQPVVLLVEVEELGLLLHEGQLALRGVAPPVVLAGELAARPLRLLAGVVVPDQLVAAVTADVVEGVDLAVLPAHDHDGGAGGGDLLREVAARARHLLDAADVQPGPGEDGLALELVVLRRDRVLVGHRPGAELGVVLGPAAHVGLREVRHAFLQFRSRRQFRCETAVQIETAHDIIDLQIGEDHFRRRSSSSSIPKDRKARARIS